MEHLDSMWGVWLGTTYIQNPSKIANADAVKITISPKLEYFCQLWCPTQTGDIEGLQHMQRRFIQKITRVQNLLYWTQLKELSSYSLE